MLLTFNARGERAVCNRVRVAGGEKKLLPVVEHCLLCPLIPRRRRVAECRHRPHANGSVGCYPRRFGVDKGRVDPIRCSSIEITTDGPLSVITRPPSNRLGATIPIGVPLDHEPWFREAPSVATLRATS